MSDIVNKKTLIDFYLDYKMFSLVFLSFMMFFSVGFYLVFWVYNLNRKFEKFDFANSPDSSRGFVILFVIPLIWLFVMFIFKVLIFSGGGIILRVVNIVGWFLVMFLVLQYLYDFCVCFGKFTMTNGFIWYMFLWVGFFPLVLVPFGSFYFLPILMFPIITIIVMQWKLNLETDRFSRSLKDSKFYSIYGTRK